MSYPIDLDEYEESTLTNEVFRRMAARREGKCDYCGRPFNVEPACKFPDRHRGVVK